MHQHLTADPAPTNRSRQHPEIEYRTWIGRHFPQPPPSNGNYLLDGNFSTIGPVSRNRLALTVRRLGDPTGEVSINWSTADGTAIGGIDYLAATGTLTRADGDGGDKTINVTLIDNALIEPARTFIIALSDPVGPIAAGPSATVSIIDAFSPCDDVQTSFEYHCPQSG